MTRVDPARAALVLGVTALLAVALLAAGGTSPVELGAPAGFPQFGLPTAPDGGDGGQVRPPGVDGSDGRAGGVLLGVVLVVVALLALLGAAALLTLRRVRTQQSAGATAEPAAAPAAPEPAAVHDALRASRADLDLLRRQGRPGDAVVAAWQRLEELTTGTAAARASHHTPTEFAGLLFAMPGMDADAVSDLRRRYSRARFSTAQVTDADAASAGDALDRITAALPWASR